MKISCPAKDCGWSAMVDDAVVDLVTAGDALGAELVAHVRDVHVVVVATTSGWRP